MTSQSVNKYGTDHQREDRRTATNTGLAKKPTRNPSTV